MTLDEAERQTHQELERLYMSTRAAKHFQKDVVKGVEGFVSTGKKQLEVESRLAEGCKKYGLEGPSITQNLSRATQHYSSAKNRMEKERENFHRVLASQVVEPLKAMVHGAPLVDARHLKQKYDRLCQEVGERAFDVNRRKSKDANGNPEHAAKLRAAQQKLEENTSAMSAMGKNATSAMTLVEFQQQQTNLQKMLALVAAERAYFQRVTSILDTLHHEIESEVRKASNPSNYGDGASRNSYHGAGPVPEISYPETLYLENTPTVKGIPYQETRLENSPSVTEIPYPETPPSDSETAYTETHSDTETPYLETPPSNTVSHMTANLSESAHNISNESNKGYDNDHDQEVEVPACVETKSFYAVATHSFEREDDGELSLSVGDEVLVREVSSSGWSQGECNGQSGWFPSTYVERKQPIRKGRRRPGSGHGSGGS